MLVSSGTFANGSFVPQALQLLDGGPSLYAPQTMRDTHGRRVLWGWLREGRDREAQRAAGWSGVMSLPRILSLRPDGSLAMAVAPELAALRLEHTHIAATPIAEDGIVVLPAGGDALEIVALLDPQSADRCGLSVRCSPDGSEATHIVYDRRTQQLIVDTRQAGAGAPGDVFGMACPWRAGELVKLHIFVDRSVLEVFANDAVAIAARMYPTRADSAGVRLFAQHGTAALHALDMWSLDSIW